MYAFDNTLNAGRFSVDHYTLPRLLDMVRSLSNGVNKAFPITVCGATADMSEAVDLLLTLVKANVTESTGAVKAINGVAALDIIARLEGVRNVSANVVVDGNTRALAALLSFGLTGNVVALATVEVDGTLEELRLASFKGNADQLLASGLSWKARTRMIGRFLEASPTATREVVATTFNLKVGTAQHAITSAVAIAKHDLDLDSCESLTASQWRDVRDAPTRSEAVLLAYGATPLVRAWSPAQVARKAIENGYKGKHAPMLKILSEGSADDFSSFLVSEG